MVDSDHLSADRLSANEFAAIRSCGFEPIGQVMGGCVHRISLFPTGGADYANAVRNARRLALERMAKKANRAHGVVGVRIHLRWANQLARIAEVVAIGTAIRARGVDRSEGQPPFLALLCGVDFAKLLRAGYVPIGIAIGACALWVGRRSGGPSTGAWYGEVQAFGVALQQAREAGLRGMRSDLARMRAEGCVGVEMDTSVHFAEQGGRIVELLVQGTGLLRFQPPLSQRGRPLPVLKLR